VLGVLNIASRAAGDIAVSAGNHASAFVGLGAGDVAVAVGKSGPNAAYGVNVKTEAIAFGSLSSGVSVGTGARA